MFFKQCFLKQYWRLILIVLLQEHATLCIYQHEIVSPHVFSMFLITHHTRLFKDAFICVCELGLGQRWWGFSGNFYLSSGCQPGVDSEYVGDLCIYSNPMEILIYGALKNCFEYQYPEKRVVNSIAEFVEGERGVNPCNSPRSPDTVGPPVLSLVCPHLSVNTPSHAPLAPSSSFLHNLRSLTFAGVSASGILVHEEKYLNTF